MTSKTASFGQDKKKLTMSRFDTHSSFQLERVKRDFMHFKFEKLAHNTPRSIHFSIVLRTSRTKLQTTN